MDPVTQVRELLQEAEKLGVVKDRTTCDIWTELCGNLFEDLDFSRFGKNRLLVPLLLKYEEKEELNTKRELANHLLRFLDRENIKGERLVAMKRKYHDGPD